MAKFGASSTRRLETAHPVLQMLFKRVVMFRDCSIVEGHRDRIKQDYYYRIGTSKVKWPHSKHNSEPSMAVDCVPYPEKWGSKEAFFDLRETILDEWTRMKEHGLNENFELRWGGDWDSDGDFEDQTFNDLPHWELKQLTGD